MASFVRQKRQTRFYWAELGFMALGLLGLQPSLFTNFLLGTQSKPSSAIDTNYTSISQSADAYKDWASSQLNSLLTQHAGPLITPQGWAPAPITSSYVPSTSYNPTANTAQHAYAAPPAYGQQQAATHQNYAPASYAQQAPVHGQNGQQSAYMAQTTPNPFYSNQPYPNYPSNQSNATFGQTGNPYSQTPNGSMSTPFQTATPGYPYSNTASPYSNATGVNGSGINYSPNNGNNTFGLNGVGTTPASVPTQYNSVYQPNPANQQYLTPQGYPIPQSNTAVNSSNWQRYQPVTNPYLYR